MQDDVVCSLPMKKKRTKTATNPQNIEIYGSIWDQKYSVCLIKHFSHNEAQILQSKSREKSAVNKIKYETIPSVCNTNKFCFEGRRDEYFGLEVHLLLWLLALSELE